MNVLKKKIIAISALALIISATAATQAFAYTLEGWKYSSPSIKYNNDSLSSTYTTVASNAMNAWHNAYSTISFSYNGTSSGMDWYYGDYGNTGWNASTSPTLIGNTMFDAVISLNNTYMKNYTPSKNQGLIM